MIIVTSLSPKPEHAEKQQAAVKSWQNFGAGYSLNTREEVCNMGIDIPYIETDKTINGIVGKRLININAMLDFAVSEGDDLLLINSDIQLDSLPLFNNDGITILSRWDYTDSFEDARIFNNGFDVFFIPKQFLTLFPPSIYAMGAAWWDYWIPYRAMLAGVKVYWPQGKHAFHKIHPTQYSQDEWNYIGEYFRWEFNINKKLMIGQIATNILQHIQLNSIRC